MKEQLITEEDFQQIKKRKCWLFDYRCPCRTGLCGSRGPDDGCYVYRWFKALTEFYEKEWMFYECENQANKKNA